MTTTADRIAATADPQDLAERRRAARALLKRPLLASGSTDPDDLRLVRRHQSELIRLFADGLGYRLQVDPTSARLFKTGLGTDSTRPLRRRSGASFTPRAYALLCLTIAALTRARPIDERFMRRSSSWSILGSCVSAMATWSTGPISAPNPSSTSDVTCSPSWWLPR